MPILAIANDLADKKIKVYESLKKNGIIVAETYQSQTGEMNNTYTLLTNAGIVGVNYETQSLFINNDIVHINENGDFVSNNARITDAFLKDLDYKIISKAENEKYVIQVFTDISCPHCRKFHTMLPQLNRSGITVEMILMSGQGDKTPAFNYMSAIQSQPDQLQALSNQMNSIFNDTPQQAASTQMAIHQQAAIALAVRGTPAIYYKGLNLPVVSPEKYMPLLQNIDSTLANDGVAFDAHRVN